MRPLRFKLSPFFLPASHLPQSRDPVARRVSLSLRPSRTSFASFAVQAFAFLPSRVSSTAKPGPRRTPREPFFATFADFLCVLCGSSFRLSSLPRLIYRKAGTPSHAASAFLCDLRGLPLRPLRFKLSPFFLAASHLPQSRDPVARRVSLSLRPSRTSFASFAVQAFAFLPPPKKEGAKKLCSLVFVSGTRPQLNSPRKSAPRGTTPAPSRG